MRRSNRTISNGSPFCMYAIHRHTRWHTILRVKAAICDGKALHQLGWREVEVVDDDLGRSAAGTPLRAQGLSAWLPKSASATWARSGSRGFAICRNSREWQQLVEVCRIVLQSSHG